MTPKIEVRMDPPLYACACDFARPNGSKVGSNPGVAAVIRRALRYYLNKNGYTKEELDHTGPTGTPADGLTERQLERR